MWSLKHGPPKNKLPIGVTDSALRRRAPAFTRANDTEHDTFTHEFQARRSRETRSGSPSRARYYGRSLHSPDGRTPSRKDLRMKPTSVTPTLAPREADDTAICARKSLAEPSGYGHRSAASPPAARDSRGRLRRDGPRARLGSCSGRSSSSRLHCAGDARRSSSWRSWRWSSRRGRHL